jgi:hypothetical protein
MANSDRAQMHVADNDIDDSLLDSPVKSNAPDEPDRKASNAKHGSSRPPAEEDAARDAALQKELASVRKVNEVIEGVLQNLERAKSNMIVRNA